MTKGKYMQAGTATKLRLPKNLLALGAFVALAILLTVVWFFYAKVETRTLPPHSYRFQIGQRQELGDRLKLRHDKNSVTMKSNTVPETTADSTPIFYGGQDRLILPRTMAVCQTEQLRIGRCNYFSQLYMEDGAVWVQDGQKKSKTEPGFFFDGSDLYLFPEAVTITWGDKSVTLPPLSYAVVRYNQSLELYNRETDSCTIELTGKQTVNATTSGCRVNMSTDILIDAQNNQILLFNNPELLPDIL